jgi:teichuronic acid biosynthesis glycosyltransferase TuaC
MPDQPAHSLRLAIVSTSYPQHPGDPSGHFVETEARRLARGGADVTVLCPGEATTSGVEAPRVIRFPDQGLFGWPGAIPRLREDPGRLLGLGRFAAAASWWLSRHGPFDRVIAHWIVPSAWPISVVARAPLEVVAHGSDVRLLLRTPRLARLVVGHLLRQGAEFRFVSRQLRDELCEVVGAKLAVASRVELPPLELPAVPAREEARIRLGISTETRLVLIVSRLVPGKRLATALTAACLVPAASIVAVGDGPLHSALSARFEQVRFVGRQSRFRTLTWMAAADVLIAASRSEGAPTVVREARTLGLAVVAAPAGDLAEWFEADPDLELVSAPPGTADALD